MAPSYQSPKLEIRGSGVQGIGTIAVAPIAKGEVLVVTNGRVLTREQAASGRLPLHPFQIEGDLHLGPDDDESENYDGIFAVNHSCEPNAGLRGQVTLVAMRDIAAGEEICFDYAMTDSAPEGESETYRMNCLCGKPACRRVVTDHDWRKPELRDKYRGYFSSYLAARLDCT